MECMQFGICDYAPRQVEEVPFFHYWINLCAVNTLIWAGDILATLNQRGLIGKQEATDINTGGRKTYYYFAKGKLPI